MKNELKDNVNDFFWDIYASAYDDISKYYNPYKKIQSAIISQVSKSNKKCRVLDAGCGTGAISLSLAGKGYKIDAVDVSEGMIKVLEKKIKNGKITGIKVSKGNFNKRIARKNCHYGMIISVHSLFMLDNINFTLKEFARVLKSGGLIIIAHNRALSLSKMFAAEVKNEGIAGAVVSVLRMLKVGILNVFLGHIHRKVFGNMSAQQIKKFLKTLKFKQIYQSKEYYGYSDLMIFKKTG